MADLRRFWGGWGGGAADCAFTGAVQWDFNYPFHTAGLINMPLYIKQISFWNIYSVNIIQTFHTTWLR